MYKILLFPNFGSTNHIYQLEVVNSLQVFIITLVLPLLNLILYPFRSGVGEAYLNQRRSLAKPAP